VAGLSELGASRVGQVLNEATTINHDRNTDGGLSLEGPGTAPCHINYDPVAGRY
jgi:hypothetical protein